MGESSITGPDLIRDTSEKVSLIRQRLPTAQSQQKSYAYVRHRPLEFEVGDHVFLKVMPKRGVVGFGKRGKLLPRFIGPFEILERVGTIAYWLALPPSMSGVHVVFYVSMLWRYTPNPAHVWIRERLWLTHMGPSMKDQCVLWIAEIRFCDARP